MPTGLWSFSEVWCVDFEFSASKGDRPKPICLVAWEAKSGRRLRIWEDELYQLEGPPYPVDGRSVLVAYYASAELGCHLALGWPLPEKVLDLYVEFRCATNGLPTPCGNGLLGALVFYGLSGVEAAKKDEMRQLALSDRQWTAEERSALLDYCESDVAALSRLLARMDSAIDLPRALLRGQYMKAAARMEHVGVPLEAEALERLRDLWPDIQERLIQRIDADYGVFEGRTFKAARWAQWLAQQDIPWPRLPSGNLALDDDTFREMARSHPRVAPIRELRVSLSQMRLADLSVGQDGRNRCLLSAFQSRTGRNQPSSTQFIFGPAVWLRGLIRPQPGWGLTYVDWEQQEFGIAAALSGDANMLEAYRSGDPYLAFGKQAGAIPPDGTRASHNTLREQFKSCVLAVQYGMGAESLSQKIAEPTARARQLLQMHRETYRVFWRWSDGAVDHAMLRGNLYTVFGWPIHVGTQANPRSLRNFPMQANGAEMLRLACCLATEGDIRVCAPVHDAILIEAPLDRLEEAVEATQQAMVEASQLVLDGFPLRSEAKRIRYPEQYSDQRGQRMWNTVWEIVAELESDPTCASTHTQVLHECNVAVAPAHTRPI